MEEVVLVLAVGVSILCCSDWGVADCKSAKLVHWGEPHRVVSPRLIYKTRNQTENQGVKKLPLTVT